MPRIPLSLLRASSAISHHLRVLLPATRDLASARNELRWIREHVASSVAFSSEETRQSAHRRQGLEHQVARLCRRRGRGVPLQYVLGSQPFGNLEIKCRPGVLVPRPETEAWALHLGRLLRGDNSLLGLAVDRADSNAPRRRQKGISRDRDGDQDRDVRIVDFCTGTGCIALSLFSSATAVRGKFRFGKVHVRGLDVSPLAVALASENLAANVRSGALPPPTDDESIGFHQANAFDDEAIRALREAAGDGSWDILVSNPPYVSRDVWAHGRGQMGFSVRKYEPRLALVPGEDVPTFEGCEHEDVFYARLLDVAERLRTKVVVFEVGDEGQAVRVVRMAMEKETGPDHSYEIWRDWPDLSPADDEKGSLNVKGFGNKGSVDVRVRGSGHVRAIIIRLAITT